MSKIYTWNYTKSCVTLQTSLYPETLNIKRAVESVFGYCLCNVTKNVLFHTISSKRCFHRELLLHRRTSSNRFLKLNHFCSNSFFLDFFLDFRELVVRIMHKNRLPHHHMGFDRWDNGCKCRNRRLHILLYQWSKNKSNRRLARVYRRFQLQKESSTCD